MKVSLETVELRSTQEFQMICITDRVCKAVADSGIKNGILFVISSNTTCGVMVNEGLPCVEKDIELMLEELVPFNKEYLHAHYLPTYGTTGGNSPGHIKSMLSGNHCVFPIEDGKMVCGHAQDIYFVEFDGVKPRKYYIQMMGD